MSKKNETSCFHERKQTRRIFVTLGIFAIINAIWFAFRTGTKPSRYAYPCQQTALSNMQLLKDTIVTAIPGIAGLKSFGAYIKPVLILVVLTMASFGMTSGQMILDFDLLQSNTDNYTRIPLVLSPQTASTTEQDSDLFVIQNATGLEGDMTEAVNALFNLMASQGLHFFETSSTSRGLIGSNDVVILKMNSQWEYRGGTNTDLIKSVIESIINHPEGFTGEIIIADNGQGLGNLDRQNANGYIRNQSAQEVADLFYPTWDVSTFLWDNLRESTVNDYDEGDFIDGYVRSSVWNNETQMYISYPKFASPASGNYISFKEGIWNNETGFDSDRLKVINMPVLKSHELLGVTACVKHYMGVPQGYPVPEIDLVVPHEHFSVRLGGMGAMIAETRAPALNILDMIWINPHPLESSVRRGPWSTYPSARFTDIIGASVDPVALDYWSAKNVIMPTAEYENYSSYSSLDPDYEPICNHINYPYVQQEESFHNYLERSMNVMKDAGFQVTMNETEMNVFIDVLSDRPIIPLEQDSLDLDDLLFVVILPLSALILIALIVVARKRRN